VHSLYETQRLCCSDGDFLCLSRSVPGGPYSNPLCNKEVASDQLERIGSAAKIPIPAESITILPLPESLFILVVHD
jgi:hypothetical protein